MERCAGPRWVPCELLGGGGAGPHVVPGQRSQTCRELKAGARLPFAGVEFRGGLAFFILLTPD